MKKYALFFLKAVCVLTALVFFVGLLRFPPSEGRAVGLSLLQIYADPFILALYLGSVPFFWGLYNAFVVLTRIQNNQTFSTETTTRLKNIQSASVYSILCIVAALVYIRFFAHGDDPAGPTTLGILASLLAASTACGARVFRSVIEEKL